MKKIKEFYPPFGVGDVVVLNKKGQKHWRRIEGEQVVVECFIHGVNNYDYSLISCAWVLHEHLTLVRKADAKSINEVFNRNGE